jgi:hypothetical protein
MFESLGNMLEMVPFMARVRRNHALEHATVHMLSRRRPNMRMVGYSINRGIFLIGALETDQVEAAADEALARLRAGESHWALHPNCGTSLLTSGVMASMAALLSAAVTRGEEERPLRLPTMVLFSIVALTLARPLGLDLQRHVTTEACMGGLNIVQVRRLLSRPMTVHFIETGMP